MHAGDEHRATGGVRPRLPGGRRVLGRSDHAACVVHLSAWLGRGAGVGHGPATVRDGQPRSGHHAERAVVQSGAGRGEARAGAADLEGEELDADPRAVAGDSGEDLAADAGEDDTLALVVDEGHDGARGEVQLEADGLARVDRAERGPARPQAVHLAVVGAVHPQVGRTVVVGVAHGPNAGAEAGTLVACAVRIQPERPRGAARGDAGGGQASLVAA
mmetsp:Transcript_3157/g.9762  ORF Transcript_3157/g.9762 Transcript_3157/m.9762 type:complete len:217 (-) Transcript_3157:535-1185(-)